MTGETALQAPTTYYSYAVDPHQLTIGATADLLLTISNLNPADPDAPDDEDERTILVRIPVGPADGDLTESPRSIRPVARTPGWDAALRPDPEGYLVEIFGPPIAPGRSAQVELRQIQVNDAVGAVILPVIEDFSGDVGGVIAVKERPEMKIIEFTAEPGKVAMGRPCDLLWTVSGGTNVEVLPLDQTFTVDGTAHFSDRLPVTPSPPHSLYTLKLRNDNGRSVEAVTAAYVGKVTASLTCDPPGPLDLDDTVTLTWKSQFAIVPLSLSPLPRDLRWVGEHGSVAVKPFDVVQPNQSSVTFTVQADGYTGDAGTDCATASVTIPLNPLRILWFRYTDETKTAFSFATRNADREPARIDMVSANSFRLTVSGPGGPAVAYLGPGPFLQVQTLTATPNPAPRGAPVTVVYTALNAASASLNGAKVPFDAAEQTGRTTVTATEGCDLVLTVTGKDGKTVSSLLPLAVIEESVADPGNRHVVL